MIVVKEARGRLEELTEDQFVSAVIREHERVIAGLTALASGTWPLEDAAGEDAEIIRSYEALYGVDDGVMESGNAPGTPRIRERSVTACS